MTGSITGVHPLVAAVLYSFAHALQDVERWTQGLSTVQLWRRSGEVAPVGFHIVHLGGSADRLVTYAAGEQLNPEQLQELRAEQEISGVSRDDLLAGLNTKLAAVGERVRALDVSDLAAAREIGRKRIPVPLGVLLTHIAEHTQRHVGAAIVTAKVAREAEASLRKAD